MGTLMLVEYPCLTSAPYQGAPNASKIFNSGFSLFSKAVLASMSAICFVTVFYSPCQCLLFLMPARIYKYVYEGVVYMFSLKGVKYKVFSLVFRGKVYIFAISK